MLGELSKDRRRLAIKSSGETVFVWTISGIVLAACGGGGGGGGGLSFGPRPTAPPVNVSDGPVSGARVYFDTDGDGEVSAAEVQGDGYRTGTDGQTDRLPLAYRGAAFVAIVDGAIDTDTGKTLSGSYQSIASPDGQHRIATPITDLIARAQREDETTEAVVARILTAAEMDPETANQQLEHILDPAYYDAGTDEHGYDLFIISLTNEVAKDKASGRPETDPIELVTDAVKDGYLTPATISCANTDGMFAENFDTSNHLATLTHPIITITTAVIVGVVYTDKTTGREVTLTGTSDRAAIDRLFSIDLNGGSPQISFVGTGGLDFESVDEYTLTVDLEDASEETIPALVKIIVTDVNALTMTKSGTATLTEEVAGVADGTKTGFSITLADTDEVNQHAITIDDASLASRFDFVEDDTTANQWNLVLLAGQKVDREADSATLSIAYTITHDTNPPINDNVGVSIIDTNDNGPTVAVTGAGRIDERIAGNTDVITATGLTITIADDDATAAHQTTTAATLTFKVYNDDDPRTENTDFRVVDDGSGNWVLQYTGTTLSAESGDGTIALKIEVSDGVHTPPDMSDAFTLTVTNLDEGDATYAITGDTENNGMLSVAVATADPDGLVANSEKYRWFILNSNGSIPAENEANGNIGATASLTLPADVSTNVYGVVVTYMDNAGEMATATVIASLLRFASSSVSKTTPENVGDTATLATVTATLITNPSVTPTYTLTDSANGKFVINPMGKISLASGETLDFENTPDLTDGSGNKGYVLKVDASATDNGKTENAPTATVTIIVTDENDITPVLSVDTSGATAIAENAAGADTGIVFSVADDDTVNTITYRVAATTSNADNDEIAALFEVDSASGALRLSGNNALDREHDALKTSGQISLTITANDGAQDSSNTETVTVTVTDVNDFGPVFTDGATRLVPIQENLGSGTTVIDPNPATDGDATPENRVLEYSIVTVSGGGSGFFDLDTGTGGIILTKPFDYESTPLLTDGTTNRGYVITLQVEDQDGLQATQTLTVMVDDVDDVDPEFGNLDWQEGTGTAGATTRTIDENTTGTLLTIPISDSDTAGADLNVRIVGTAPMDANNNPIFVFEKSVDNANAELRVATNSKLDFEHGETYTLTLEVNDGTRTDTETVTINVNNLNDEAPAFANASPNQIVWAFGFTNGVIPEDAYSKSDVLVATIEVNDADGATFLEDRTFDIIGTDSTAAKTKFAIRKNAAGNGELYLVGALDREGGTPASYKGLKIEVNDGQLNDAGKVATNPFNIGITDVNDEPTVIGATKVLWASIATSGAIAEASYTAGTEVARAIVSDDDASSDLEYRLTKGDGTFSIGITDGIITFTANTDVDADTAPTSYTLAYEVRDRTGAWEPSGDITLTITNTNDESPTFADPVVVWESGFDGGVIPESTDGSTTRVLVGRVAINDADGATAFLDDRTFAINGAGTKFVIVRNTDTAANGGTLGEGLIYLTDALDREGADPDPAQHTGVTITVTDGAHSPVTSKAFNIDITDINDNAPTMTTNGTATLTEEVAGVAGGTETGFSITLTDKDTDAVNDHDIEVVGDEAERFGFVFDSVNNQWNLVLLAGQKLDREEDGATIEVEYTITDGGNPPITGRSFTIHIEDVNEFAPTMTITGDRTINERIASDRTTTPIVAGITITLDDADATDGPEPTITVYNALNNSVSRLFDVVKKAGGADNEYQIQFIDVMLNAIFDPEVNFKIGVSDGDDSTEDPELMTITLTVNNVDEGDATYIVSGSVGADAVLTARLATGGRDPDGRDSSVPIMYRWFTKSSTDPNPTSFTDSGTGDFNWLGAESTDNTYTIMGAPVAGAIYGVLVRYKDNSVENTPTFVSVTKSAPAPLPSPAQIPNRHESQLEVEKPDEDDPIAGMTPLPDADPYAG